MATPTGWAFPGSSRKAYYFPEGGIALCGKWMNLGMPAEAHEPDTGPSPDDCAACRRKLDKAAK